MKINRVNTLPQLSDEYYELFRELILERTGMSFGPRRRNELASGVLAAAGRADCERLEEYHRLLLGARTDSELWDDLIGAITVGETYFFRDPAQFDALRQRILPDLIAHHQHDHRLRVWSAGCSTGEEPYSIAILLHRLLPDIADWNILILATDINKQALQQARQGRYREWSFRQTDPATRELYFTPANGSWNKGRDRFFHLSPQVRDAVTFAYLNLVEDAYPSLATNTNAMDLILCRNVAIYLPEAVIRIMAERFHRCLVTDGWLIVGASETGSMNSGQYATRNCRGAILYQKTQEREQGTREQGTEVLSVAKEKEQVASRKSQVTSHKSQVASPTPAIDLRPETCDLRPATLPQTHPTPDLYQEGLVLLGQGRYEEAMTRFLDCIERDPTCALAYYQMARVHANRGQLEEGRSWCQQAIKRDPLLTEAHYILALIHQEEGALDEALAQIKKTLYLDSGFVLACFTLANLYQQVNRQDEAARYRAQAIRLAAKMPPEDVLPGSDDLTAGRLLTMIRATM